MPFVEQSLYFNGSAFLDYGSIWPALDGLVDLTVSLWIRYDGAGWTSGSRPVLTQNAANQRRFSIVAHTRNNPALGDLQFGLGAGPALVSGYLPAGTLWGRDWSHVVLSKRGSDVRVTVNGLRVPLTNISGPFPHALGNSLAPLQVGGASAGNRWLGQLCNVAMWEWAATDEAARELWARGMAVDYRTIPSTPSLFFYAPMNGTTVELVSGAHPTGVMPVVSHFVPASRMTRDEVFDSRFLINTGTDPWFYEGQTPGGGVYSASPSVVRDSRARALAGYSRGISHTNKHALWTHRSEVDLAYMPISGKPWPHDPDARVWTPLPTGPLTNASSEKRSCSLSRIAEIGDRGRIFVVLNETDLGTPPPVPERHVWHLHSDEDGDTWSGPVKFLGKGTKWNSIGRAKVRRLRDGSLVFGYYYRDLNESRYTAAVARSTNDGLSFEHWSDIAQAPLANGGAQYEEPYLQEEIDGRLICSIRVDSGVDDRVNGGAPFTRHILRCESTDGLAQVWTLPTVAHPGWSHPFWLYRPSDGIMAALARGPTLEDRSPRLIVSKDLGVAWSAPVGLPSPWPLGAYMQGELFLTLEDRIGAAWAQECSATGASVANAAMWSGTVREELLQQMLAGLG